LGLGERTSFWTAGDRRKGAVFGGYAWPTDAATRGSGFVGVEEDFEEVRCDDEWECDCADRGGGLVAVFVTIVDVSVARGAEEVEVGLQLCGTSKAFTVFENP